MDSFAAAKQQLRTLTFGADASVAEDVMTHRRPKPGSFQDDLGDVIERIAPADVKSKPRPQKTTERRISNSAELNDRLFENAWKKGR